MMRREATRFAASAVITITLWEVYSQFVAKPSVSPSSAGKVTTDVPFKLTNSLDDE